MIDPRSKYRFCFKHNCFLPVCGCPAVPRSGQAGSPRDERRKGHLPPPWFREMTLMLGLLALIGFGLLAHKSHAAYPVQFQGVCYSDTPEAVAAYREIHGLKLYADGSARVTSAGTVTDNGATVLIDLNTSNTIYSTATTTTGTVPLELTKCNMTDLKTDGGVLSKTGFIVFLVGMVLCFSGGYISGAQR